MALNTCEMWFNGIKIAFFPKIYKKSPNGWALFPLAPEASGGWRPAPRSLVCDTLSYTTFLNTFSKLDICTFQLLVQTLSLCKILVTYQQATISDLPSYDMFVPQKLSLWKNFDDVISCNLWFRPPPIKNSGYAYKLKIAWKTFFEGFNFFFWRTLTAVSLVLGPGLKRSCFWTREDLSS